MYGHPSKECYRVDGYGPDCCWIFRGELAEQWAYEKYEELLNGECEAAEIVKGRMGDWELVKQSW